MMLGGQFGKSLFIWVEVTLLLEDAGKNQLRVADFSVMMVEVDLGPQQIVMQVDLTNPAPNCALTIMEDMSWRRPEQCADPAFTFARRIGIQPGVMVRGLISFDNRTLWLPLEAHVQHSARSSDISPIEHVWDIKKSRVRLPGTIDVLARQLEHIGQEMLQETISCLITLCHVVWLLASRLEDIAGFRWFLWLGNLLADRYMVDRRNRLLGGRVSTDGQQRRAPLRRGVNEAFNHELGYFVPLFSREALSSSWRVCGGGWRPATRLPRASQTCSIGFMSGEHVGHSISTVPSSKRKSSTRSDDLIPISVSGQRSISNDAEVCAPVKGDATIHQHSPFAKSDTFVHDRSFILTATVHPDENTSVIRMNTKTELVRKKNIAPFISPPVHMLCCPLPAVATMP
ncbi:uncharacterized protein TNCV_430821 [Trichonephila clavipes]|nr:uncharacterized protein TNCV_430821 [Trichonephila clavipes]